ncbi:MAG: UDP-3-O-acyl-N-acetylglucosamine deacetylase [Armatimonadetes bacterium]|nr:UDP-3-O-acyl-N-acetylglucosamine deacetylase [Armatimonadota bacterium]
MGSTLQSDVALEGTGLHTGQNCQISLVPQSSGGIRLQIGSAQFPARWDYVLDTVRCTRLGVGGSSVATVEHLMSALWARRVTDLLIEVKSGQEIPALDGSAKEFLAAIDSVGLEPSETEPVRLSSIVEVADGDRTMSAMPGIGIATVETQLPWGPQRIELRIDDYDKEIAPARTYGLLREVEALRAQGLGLGGTLDNALILDENGYYNSPRFPDEPTRHKALDALGDLYLCGRRLDGFDLVAKQSGHALAVRLAQAVGERLAEQGDS